MVFMGLKELMDAGWMKIKAKKKLGLLKHPAKHMLYIVMLKTQQTSSHKQ